jgi:hypothetical protein
MHLRATNNLLQTSDVYGFGFEPAGVLEFANEYSGLAALPAHLYCFRRTQACMTSAVNCSTLEATDEDTSTIHI